ncbi:hypothetical protein N7447_010054, partial [Penicillium robsamsonii]|uniref:uncharacterized protein n=1 Tax=Penicillium robsamsonii TaxID=1792511 RepID=UPI0025483805
YVDSSLIGTRKFDKAAIFSAAGDGVWATSPGLKTKPEDIQSLVQGYNDAGSIFASGFWFDGQKYMSIKANDRSIYGRKGKEGVCAVKTKQTILVGHYPEGVTPGEAAKVIEQLGDYLIGMEY